MFEIVFIGLLTAAVIAMLLWQWWIGALAQPTLQRRHAPGYPGGRSSGSADASGRRRDGTRARAGRRAA